MTSQTDAERARGERLSALLDGELDAPACEHACAGWHGDSEARRDWHAWHLIGDVLRSDDLASPAGRDLRFLAVVRERLANEAVVLAPEGGRIIAAAAARQPHRRRLDGWRAPGAIAAGIAVVAGALVLMRPASAPAPIVAVADEAVVAGAAAPAAGGDSRLALAGSGVDRRGMHDARLELYLDAHKQFSGSSALGVPSTFLSSATVDPAAR